VHKNTFVAGALPRPHSAACSASPDSVAGSMDDHFDHCLPMGLVAREGHSVVYADAAMDNWCLRRILNIHSSEFVTNDEIRSRTGQPLLSDTVRSGRLSFFGHLHRADPWQHHHRALQACIMDPPGDWRRRACRPRQSWLRTMEADLRPMNLGLATAKRRAQDRLAWRLLVATATSSTSC